MWTPILGLYTGSNKKEFDDSTRNIVTINEAIDYILLCLIHFMSKV